MERAAGAGSSNGTETSFAWFLPSYRSYEERERGFLPLCWETFTGPRHTTILGGVLPTTCLEHQGKRGVCDCSASSVGTKMQEARSYTGYATSRPNALELLFTG